MNLRHGMVRWSRRTWASRRCVRPLPTALLALAATLIVPRTSLAGTWIDEYVAVATRADADCRANELKACRAGLVRLGELTDGRPDFRCRLARIDAALGANAEALEHLGLCIRSGLAFKDLAADPKLAAVRALPAYGSVEREARRLGAPAAGYERHIALADRDLIAEDVVHDDASQTFYVSSVRERKILRVNADGTAEDFITEAQSPLWGVFALALDRPRGVLWATTSAGAESPPFGPKDEGASAVLKFDLRTRALLGRYELHDGRPHGFGDVTLAEDGELLVSDGIGGGVYRITPGEGAELRTVVGVGSFRSPQTPALVKGAGKVLVPDYSRGIALVDRQTGVVRWLTHPPELALFGIDGLYLEGRALIAIQNGTVPERVLVMTLDPTCTSVTSWHAQVANVAALGDPTHGVFVGPDFYFLANSGWDRVQDDGSLRQEKTARPAELWRLRMPMAAAARRASCPRRDS